MYSDIPGLVIVMLEEVQGTDQYRGSPYVKLLPAAFKTNFSSAVGAFLVFLETVFYSCCSQKINVENTSNLPVLLKEIKHDSYFYLLLGIYCKETIW